MWDVHYVKRKMKDRIPTQESGRRRLVLRLVLLRVGSMVGVIDKVEPESD